MNRTQLQQDVINAIIDNGNVIVKATAGSGKTTTITMAVTEIMQRNRNAHILATAFNVAIKSEMERKMPFPNVGVFTMHQVGLSILKASNVARRFQFDAKLHGKSGKPDNKYRNILIDIIGQDYNLRGNAEVWVMINETFDLVEKLRIENVDESDFGASNKVAAKFGIGINPEIWQYAKRAIAQGITDYIEKGHNDFTDMLWLPVRLNLEVKRGLFVGNKTSNKTFHNLDYLLIDESQDASPLIQELLGKIVKTFGCKVLAVGDPMQSIMGFAGADPHAFENLGIKFGCKEMPLNETFRCPKEHVEFVNGLYPDANMVSRSAVSGTIENIVPVEMANLLTPGAIVMARTNSEVLIAFLQALRAGVPSRLIGIDLLSKLDDLFDMVEKKVDNAWSNIFQAIEDWRIAQSADFMRKYSTYTASRKIADMNDDLQFLFAYLEFFIEQADSRSAFMKAITDLLDSNNSSNYVRFLTCHKAKGLESENVFLLGASKFPCYRDGQSDDDKRSEDNLHFVAITRSMRNLFLVG